MNYYIGLVPFSSDGLEHHGIKGQKWGVRRYQNPDGTRTTEGKERYRYGKTTPMTIEDQYKVRNTKLYKKALDVSKKRRELDGKDDPDDKQWDILTDQLSKIEEKISKKYGNASLQDLMNLSTNIWDDTYTDHSFLEKEWNRKIEDEKKTKQVIKEAKADKDYKKVSKIYEKVEDAREAIKQYPFDKVPEDAWDKWDSANDKFNKALEDFSNKHGKDNKYTIEEAIFDDYYATRKH